MTQASEQIARQYAAAAINKFSWGNNGYNVKAYGAQGDGKTDDTAAINSLITQAPNNAYIYFPEGNYIANIEISKPIKFKGYGDVTIYSSNSQYAIRTTVDGIDGITIRGIKIDGTKGLGNCGINIQAAKNISFAEIEVNNIPLTGVYIRKSRSIEIHSSRFYNCGTDHAVNGSGVNQGCALVLNNSSYANVHHNVFKETWQIPVFVWANDGECTNNSIHHNEVDTVHDNGIRFQPDPQLVGGVQDWNAVRDCDASFNKITNVTIDGIRLSGNYNKAIGNIITNVQNRAISNQGGTGSVVSKNTIHDCVEGIRLNSDIASIARVYIEGNTVYNITGGARAIGVVPAPSPVNPGLTIQDIRIVGNQVSNSAANGIEVTNASDVLFDANESCNNSKSGIYTNNVVRFLMTDNIVKNNNLVNGPWCGIYLDTGTTYGSVKGTIGTDDQATKTQSQGIFLNAGSSKVYVKGNICYGNKNAQGVLDSSGAGNNLIADNFTT